MTKNGRRQMPDRLMSKNLIGALMVCFLLLFFGNVLHAFEPPHTTNTCGSCHSGGFKDAMYDYTPNCLTCHNSQGGSAAINKPFAANDASNVFGNFTTTQTTKKWTSHAWGVSGINAAAGVPTGPGTWSYSWRTNPGKIVSCPNCHYLHANATPGEPHLRYPDSKLPDYICVNCHRSRNTSNSSSGTHPINVPVLDNVSAFHFPPLNPYTSVSGSELALKGTGGNRVFCRTCHGVHKADSNPYTNDTSFSNLSSGDGYLLRWYNDSDLCKACHNYQDHGSMTCRNCHTPHQAAGNRMLIMRNFSTPPVNGVSTPDPVGGVWREVEESKFAWRTDGKQGLCDACHELTTDSAQEGGSGAFKGWSSTHANLKIYKHMADTVNCMECHMHEKVTADGSNSFFAGDAACSGCHGQPPVLNQAGSGGFAKLGADQYDDLGTEGIDWFNESQTPHAKHAVEYPFGNMKKSGADAYGPDGKCRACHASADSTITYHLQTPHLGSNYRTITFGLYTWGVGSSRPYNGSFQCTTNYCHSNGAPSDSGILWPGTTPTWGSSGKLPNPANCGSCHPSPMTSNKHTKHVTDYSFTCNNCHNATTTGGGNTIILAGQNTKHVNRTKDIYFGNLAVTGGASPAYYPSTKRCADVYCHGDFIGGNYTSVEFNSSAPCGSCHDATAPKHSAGSHTKHATTYGFECGMCHDDTITGNGPGLNSLAVHADGDKTIAFDSTRMDNSQSGAFNSTDHSGTVKRECYNIYCHSAGTNTTAPFSDATDGPQATPKWGNAVTCDMCHGIYGYGGWQAAMPNYTSGSPKVNSHRKHVLDNGIQCKDCHNDTTTDNTTIASTTLHVNGTYDIVVRKAFDDDLDNNYSGNKCDSVDCHGGGSSPAWGDSGYCTDCHYSSVADLDDDANFTNFSGAVAKLYSSEWVTRGHGRESGSGAYDITGNNPAEKFCTSCHDDTLGHGDSDRPFRTKHDTGDTLGDLDEFCLNCHGDTATVNDAGWIFGVVTGIQNHSYANISTGGYKNLTTWRFTPKCVDCHDPHGDGNIAMVHDKVATGGSDPQGRKYTFYLNSTVVFSRFTGVLAGGVLANDDGPNKLTQICRICHTRTDKYNQAGGEIGHNPGAKCTGCHKHSNGFTPAGCQLGCHGYPPVNDEQLVGGDENKTKPPATGSLEFGQHDLHVNVLGQSCLYCHDGGMKNGVAENGSITIGFKAFTRYTTGTYDGQDVVTSYDGKSEGTANNDKKCLTVKCHGGGTGEMWLTWAGSGPGKIDPVWTDTSQVVCGNCHGARDGGSAVSWPTTGAHVKHTGGAPKSYNCRLCHDATIDGTATLSLTHVNAKSQVQLNISSIYVDGSGNYNDFAVNSAFEDCDNSYCHSLGNVTSVVTGFTTPKNPINWDENSDCNTCHGNNTYTGTWREAMPEYPDNSPKANKHVKHVGTNSIKCQVCHTVTTTDSTSIADQDNHVNKTYNVDFQIDVGGDWEEAPAKSCTDTNCHKHSVPTWGQAQDTITCQDCHYVNSGVEADVEDDFTFNSFTGAVAKIYSSTFMDTGHGRRSGSGNYLSGNPPAEKVCMDCHITGVEHGDANYFRLDLQWGTNTVDDLCLSCHGSEALSQLRGAGLFGIVTGIQSHTRPNLQAAGYTNLTTWHFTPKCIDCHDPHGDTNLFMIHDKVSHQGSDDAGRPNIFPNISAVTFDSVTGSNSYDDGIAGTPASLCSVCHDRTDHNGGPAPAHNNSTLDCRSCHKHKLGFTPSGCDGCHSYPPPDSPATWTDSDKEVDPNSVGLHAPHAFDGTTGMPWESEPDAGGNGRGYACVKCHGPKTDGRTNDHAQTGRANAVLVNMLANEVTTFNYNTDGDASSIGVTDDTCGDVTCHSGRAYPRAWAKPDDCGDCHGNTNRNSLNNIGTGSHTMHTYSGTDISTGMRYDCTNCHVDNLNNYSSHYTSKVDMNFSSLANGSGTATYKGNNPFDTFVNDPADFGTCTDVYCHGAQLDAGTQGLDTTPDWGIPASAECGDCHKTDSTLTQGAHPKHLTAPYNFSCETCHASNTVKTHVNGEVTFNDGKNKADTVVCDGCHYGGSGTAKTDWGSPTLRTCDSCHFDTADTDDFNFTGITSVSKETAKIASGGWYATGHGRTTSFPSGNAAANLACDACHDGANFDHSEFGVGGNPFRLISSNGTPDRYCTRCHGPGETGSGVTNIFTHTSSVTQTPRSFDFRIKCIDCHDPHGDNNAFMIHSTVMQADTTDPRESSDSDGVPYGENPNPSNIDFAFANDTTDYASRTSGSEAERRICTTCHTQTKNYPTDDKTRFQRFGTTDDEHGTTKCTNCHAHNGGFKGISCSDCHGYPPPLLLGSGNTEPSTTSNSDTAGKHVEHVNYFGSGNSTCAKCHDGGMQDTGGNSDMKITIDFSGWNSYTTGTYMGQAAITSYTYDGDGYGGDDATNDCSNVKCHGGGSWLTHSDGAPSIIKPEWEDAATVVCGDCHGAKDGDTLNSWPTSNMHAVHADDTTYDVMCRTCHAGAFAIAGNHTSMESTVHVNQEANVGFDTGGDARVDGSSSYIGGGIDVNATFGQCMETYCHSQGSDKDAPFDQQPTYANYTATWDVNASTKTGGKPCSMCHGNKVYSGQQAAMPNYADDDVGGPKNNSHATHVIRTPSFRCEYCHSQTTTDGLSINIESLHVNKIYNVDVAAAYDTGDPNYTEGTSTCDNIYCHGGEMGAGAVGDDTTPIWGTPATAACGDCHMTTVALGSSVPISQGSHEMHVTNYGFDCTDCHTDSTDQRHVNRSVTFADNTSLSDTTQCATCHSGDAADAKIDWSPPGNTRSCGDGASCHPGRDVVASMPISHEKHLDPNTYNLNFKCAYCHNHTVGIGDDYAIEQRANHANTVKDVYFSSFQNNSTNGTFDAGSQKRCADIYCHSNGTDLTGPYTDAEDNARIPTPDWDDPVAMNCNGCHGTDGVYGDDRDPMPNYDDESIGGPKNNSHKEHVNDNGIECMACHKTTLSANNTILDYSLHLNGSYDVSLQGKYVGTYSGGTGTCSDVTCHGGAGSSVDWGDTTVTCSSCHSTTGADVDNFVWTNITSSGMTMAKIETAEFVFSGHGLPSGNYAVTDNLAANKTCIDCHDENVNHGTAGNPFRLISSAGVGVKGASFCYKCHESTIKHHAASTTNARYTDFELKCFDCHDPHGDATSGENIYMIQRNIMAVPRPTNNYTPSDVYGVPFVNSTSGKLVEFTNNGDGDYASRTVDTVLTTICNVCHTRTGSADPPNDPQRYLRYMTGTPSTHQDGADCGGCHEHAEGFEGAGESPGGSTCTDGCHPFVDEMVISGETTTYHHVLANSGADDQTGWFGAEDSKYPDMMPQATDGPRRRCLMCHVDHDVFSTANNASNQYGRAANLRASITRRPPENAEDKTFDNDTGNATWWFSDFMQNGEGGICISCHKVTQTKNNSEQLDDGSMSTLVINYDDYLNSPHNYEVNARVGIDGGTSNFKANCSKCHNDTFTKYKFTNSTGFSVHVSKLRRLNSQLGIRIREGTVATGGSQTVFTDTFNNWTANMWNTRNVTMISGTAGNIGETRVISVNTQNQITLVGTGFANNVTAGDKFLIGDPPEQDYCYNCHGTSQNPNAGIKKDYYGVATYVNEKALAMEGTFSGEYGTSTAIGTTSITQTGAGWVSGSLVGKIVSITSGKQTGAVSTVSANTTDVMTVDAWTTSKNPAAGDKFAVGNPFRHRIDAFGGIHKSDESETAPTGLTAEGFFGAGNVDLHVGCQDCHNPHAQRKPATDRGTATGATAISLTDNTQSWTAGEWRGFKLIIVVDNDTPSMAGFERVILSNTATQLTVDVAFDEIINGVYFYIYPAGRTKEATTYLGHFGNMLNGPNNGQWGVTVSYVGTPPLDTMESPAFTKKQSLVANSDGIYNLCFKCHSEYGWGSGGDGPFDCMDCNVLNGTITTPPIAGPTTDIAREFNPNNLAHHAVVDIGNNQPILPLGINGGTEQSYNNNAQIPWPYYSEGAGNGTLSITSGDATLGSGAVLPDTTIPGWYVWIGDGDLTDVPNNGVATIYDATAVPSGDGWFQITEITDSTTFKVTPTQTVSSTENWSITAGFGNNFVPPLGPWSVISCADCHDASEVSDPKGPHGSGQNWLLKKLRPVKFKWMNSTNPGTPTYATIGYGVDWRPAADEIATSMTLCLNCHRGDIYGNNMVLPESDITVTNTWPTEANFVAGSFYPQLSRQDHGAAMDGGQAEHYEDGTSNQFGIYCMHCHLGRAMGEIHGTNEGKGSSGGSSYRGKRFLTGGAWIGFTRGKIGTPSTCYVDGGDALINNCGNSSGGSLGEDPNYDYDIAADP